MRDLASVKRRLTRAHTSDSQSFRCFLPFCPWRATDAPASKRTKIPRKSKAVRCEAVLPEQKCSQTRKRPQRILCVFSRALTQYEGISARQNRVCPCQSTQALMDMPSRRGAFPNAAKAQPRSSAVCICEGSGLRFFRLAAGRRAPCLLSILRPASAHTPSCFAT